MKRDALHEVVQVREPPQNRTIVRDQTIRLSSAGARDMCPHLLRRVEAVREDTGETLVFLTNLHHLGASTIAAIYKDRWQIELFFNALKQNLKIKTFVGSESVLQGLPSTRKQYSALTLLICRSWTLRLGHDADSPGDGCDAGRQGADWLFYKRSMMQHLYGCGLFYGDLFVKPMYRCIGEQLPYCLTPLMNGWTRTASH